MQNHVIDAFMSIERNDFPILGCIYSVPQPGAEVNAAMGAFLSIQNPLAERAIGYLLALNDRLDPVAALPTEGDEPDLAGRVAEAG